MRRGNSIILQKVFLFQCLFGWNVKFIAKHQSQKGSCFNSQERFLGHGRYTKMYPLKQEL